MNKAAVIVFPGSNCDRDVFLAVKRSMAKFGQTPVFVWHADKTLPAGVELVVLPGGFSYGDYLRCGAIAARSPIMGEVVRHANRGGYVLGICNGFQVLTETGLVEGALVRNQGLKFICKDVSLRVEATSSPFTSQYQSNQIVTMPVAHHDGCYVADSDVIKKMEDQNMIAFRYASSNGTVGNETNPNGSMGSIAGVFNAKGNVLGMMPHPERYSEQPLGGVDGNALFDGVIERIIG
ncbi:MAG: phosphoribosylformylglycinamidine synthase subunit PurQ [Alphaproteobacteria bacterium]|nr:phosphoribosylformylglycinamidine synthase subunit PurQ [Alphaproteobacteria bacterium]